MYDVAIIGGGIAGASLAYFLTRRGVRNGIILERESDPGYHTTGRSAAVLNTLDPIDSVRQLKRMGGAFLRNPPAEFSATPLLDRVGVLLLFAGADWIEAKSLARRMVEEEGERLDLLTPEQARQRMPVLAPNQFDGAIWAPDDGRIDVHGLLHGYLRHATRAGFGLRCEAEVTGVVVRDERCCGVTLGDEIIEARRVVNAAGAWAGRLAAMAGALPIELTPKRRTIVTFAAPAGTDVTGWPLVCNETHLIYFAPEGGGLLASPMDTDPMEPCDARPDELGVARALDKLATHAPALLPRSLRSKWAGLRTFAPDDNFVVGEDPRRPGFFWLAGQGGAGIETSPAVGRIAASLLVEGACADFDATAISPERFLPEHGG